MPLPANSRRLWPGALVAFAIAGLIAALLALIWSARGLGTAGPHPPDIAHLLRMTALQAGLTTGLSLVAGIVLAWALNRLRFAGRRTLVALLSASLVTPGIVVAIGVLAVWGRAGWINAGLAPFGLSTGPVFGLGGILYAHLLLDATYAAAVLLPRLDTLPATRLRLGRSLGLAPLRRFALIDWPALRPALPGLAAVIFLLAFTSFPIVLILGGGPANQTLEVAIYAAVRRDFDLGAAVALALVQLAACALLVLPTALFAPAAIATSAGRTAFWPEPRPFAALAIVLLALALFAFGLPLAAVLSALPAIAGLFGQPAFWQATVTSLAVATPSAFVTLVFAYLVASARTAAGSRLLKGLIAAPASAYLAVPGVTLALGFFLLARDLSIPVSTAAPLVLVLANTLLALPFALSILTPGLAALDRRHARTIAGLRLSVARRLWAIEAPALAREIGLVLAMGFCFSLGDLSVIALFGTEDFQTLPWLMNRAMGAYRSNDAAALAALLLLLSVAAFLALPPLAERAARARA